MKRNKKFFFKKNIIKKYFLKFKDGKGKYLFINNEVYDGDWVHGKK